MPFSLIGLEYLSPIAEGMNSSPTKDIFFFILLYDMSDTVCPLNISARVQKEILVSAEKALTSTSVKDLCLADNDLETQ